MSTVGQRERATQDRIVGLFRDRLGYGYLGDRSKFDNRNIDEVALRAKLRERGYDDPVITKAVHELTSAARVGDGRSLFEANRAVYELLRYGAKIAPAPGEPKITVRFIDWEDPQANHFGIAEEVSVAGVHDKRPDLVIYVNGIALGVIELKRSLVSVSEGIRQQIGNQDAHFIRPFFSTSQLLFAGNDVEGVRYGVIETPEKHWLSWKEDTDPGIAPLDGHLAAMCSPERFLELVHDFIVYDQGVKKVCRPNQYFGVKAAQEHVRDGRGGIIWHTQGSGKSLSMVWLARWIREHQPDPRVLVITDRIELDEQIEGIFAGVGERIHRTTSGPDLVAQLSSSEHWLIGSLIHKFGSGADEGSEADYLAQLRAALPAGFTPKGNLFVFVDECHRTQTGQLHRAMKELLPDAVFIGFTGTPLLRADAVGSLATFGEFIHTYKFDEAVEDGVVLDLTYEARDIDQELTSPEKVDAWFEAKTRGLTDRARAQLKKRWGTMRKLYSAKGRAEKIVGDILLDMETKPRLADGRGNALLVCSSIYQACAFYEQFAQSSLKGKVGLVTSYVPQPGDIAKEDAGAGQNEALRQYDIYRRMLADYFGEDPDRAVARAEEYERRVRETFVREPGQMRLLIVVDKLLTGFDAPSATYLYIDKPMRDHGLFQAICRVNRLDGEDKAYGHIVDYQDLFRSIENAVADYTGEALDGYAPEDVEGLLGERIERGRGRLDDALEAARALCEPVEQPRGTQEFQHYFCAKVAGDAEQLAANERRRVALYARVAELSRAYAALAADMAAAGYSEAEAAGIRDEVRHYDQVRVEVQLGSGEHIDLTAYEADMRYLLDHYIRAEESVSIDELGERGIIALIGERGLDAAVDALPEGIRDDPDAVAETITNNTRRVLIDRRRANPAHFEKMSQLLDRLIEQRRQDAIEYREYLMAVCAVAEDAPGGGSGERYPAALTRPAQRALFDNLGDDEALAALIDRTVREVREDSWRGHTMKERKVRRAIARALSDGGFDQVDPDAVFDVVRAQNDY